MAKSDFSAILNFKVFLSGEGSLSGVASGRRQRVGTQSGLCPHNPILAYIGAGQTSL
jgi:hypothetical protein